MAVPSLDAQGDTQTEKHPLLMEQPKANTSDMEHIILDVPRQSAASSSGSHVDLPHAETLNHDEEPSSSIAVPVSQPSSSTTITNSRGNSRRRSGDNYSRRRRSPLNSGLWISFELVVTLCQIVASIVVLSVSRHETPQAPLFSWIVGYAAGCVATLPLLYWRYVHRNSQGSEQETPSTRQSNSQRSPPSESAYISISIPRGQGEGQHRRTSGRWMRSVIINARLNVLVDHFKMALDCFFAVWFVVGNVWIFGGHSSAAEAPNLYRLCLVFLTFSCIGYAMPFICCALICCCLPCIISILGLREDLSQIRGATPESIDALPTYKFKLKRSASGEENEINSESVSEGGVLAAGTDKERVISGEDAMCCICLAKYGNNEEVRELPCLHYFHVACVDKWLKINASCPLCKAEVGEPTPLTNSTRRRSERMIENGTSGDGLESNA